MQPSDLDKLLATPTYVGDEVAQEAQDIGIPAEGRVSDNEYLERILDTLNRMSQQLAYSQPDDIDSSIAFSSLFAVTLSTRNRKFTNVLIGGTQTQQINVYVPGVGSYLVSLTPGWNTLGAPDRSDITLAAGASVTTLPARLRYSNVAYAATIL